MKKILCLKENISTSVLKKNSIKKLKVLTYEIKLENEGEKYYKMIQSYFINISFKIPLKLQSSFSKNLYIKLY